MLRDMSSVLLGASFLTMLGAKLLLGENARLAAARASLALGFWTAARLYNLSQLGKAFHMYEGSMGRLPYNGYFSTTAADPELDEQGSRWLEKANRRIHGTTREGVREAGGCQRTDTSPRGARQVGGPTDGARGRTRVRR